MAAAVKQIINTSTDASHPIAGTANARLLSAGVPNGLLYGPRSERYLAQSLRKQALSLAGPVLRPL